MYLKHICFSCNITKKLNVFKTLKSMKFKFVMKLKKTTTFLKVFKIHLDILMYLKHICFFMQYHKKKKKCI